MKYKLIILIHYHKKTANLVKPVDLGEYINQLNHYMGKEINYIMNKNNEYYENYFLLQFKDFEKNLNSAQNNLEKIEIFQEFISDYCGKFENCLQKFCYLFYNTDNSNKFFVNILMELYEDFIVKKFITISEEKNKKYDEKIYNYKEEISSLRSNIDKLNEQINIANSTVEEKNKEKVQ